LALNIDVTPVSEFGHSATLESRGLAGVAIEDLADDAHGGLFRAVARVHDESALGQAQEGATYV